MLKIEEYILRRKKEDNLNEFDVEAKTQNMKLCVDYVFEYFNNYFDVTEADDKTVLHNDKVEKYRKYLNDYNSEVREWAVRLFDEYGKKIHSYVGNATKSNELFFLYNTDSEFRNESYLCYAKLIKKLPFIQDQTEMLFQFLKEYHRVESQKRFDYNFTIISEEINEWIEKTFVKHQVNLQAFAFNWINIFFDNENLWPASHRTKSQYSWRKYDYNYRQSSNLFNLNSLYRRMPKKSFIKGRKQEFEILLMYYWLNDMESDDEYWQIYLERVLPGLKKG